VQRKAIDIDADALPTAIFDQAAARFVPGGVNQDVSWRREDAVEQMSDGVLAEAACSVRHGMKLLG
jgi:hypothetical protein